jgi:hypothetical protein
VGLKKQMAILLPAHRAKHLPYKHTSVTLG